MLPGLVDAGDEGERGGVVASVAATDVVVSISTSWSFTELLDDGTGDGS